MRKLTVMGNGSRQKERETGTPAPFLYGSRQKIIPQDLVGWEVAYQTHPPTHSEIGAGEDNAVAGPKDKQDGEVFPAGVQSPAALRRKAAGLLQ
jgi:hypothetical protein